MGRNRICTCGNDRNDPNTGRCFFCGGVVEFSVVKHKLTEQEKEALLAKVRRPNSSYASALLMRDAFLDMPIASMSEGQREAFLKNWEDTKPRFNVNLPTEFPVFYGTGGDIDPCASDGYSKSWEDLSDGWEERMDKLKKEKEKQVGSYETEKWSGTGTIVPIEEAFKK